MHSDRYPAQVDDPVQYKKLVRKIAEDAQQCLLETFGMDKKSHLTMVKKQPSL